MSKRESETGTKKGNRLRLSGFILLALNVLLLVAAFRMYSLYNYAYKDRLQKENLTNIANLNRAATVNTEALFTSWDIKLEDIIKTVQHNGLNAQETLELISNGNSSDERFFELIGSDYTGFLARQNEDGSYPVLDYSHSSYAALQDILSGEYIDTSDSINFAPEYTDAGATAEKFFAVYKHILLQNEDGEPENYVLLLATPSSNVLKLLNEQSSYTGQSTVLIDASGDYIVSSNDYKSDNFYEFLYVYNDLTLDEKNAIRREVSANNSGELFFKNAAVVVEDCVYRYERMGESGWYCVTSVPLSSFRQPTFNNAYLIYAVLMLLVLFTLDLLWMRRMNISLKVSMQREREASAAKGTFMSRMSHEIRTPLNAIIGYNTIANNELAEADTVSQRRQAEMKVLDCLKKSEIASKHLLTIINDVLDMSAIESGKVKLEKERFDFRGLITSITTVFYSQAKAKGVDFNVIFDTPTDEWYLGDHVRTNQILMNLLSNAVKFTPDGGHVTLRISQTDKSESETHIHFQVTDTGIGMTEEYLTHIWTPFEQADSSITRRFGGTGLGLSITKNLIDLMGGTIEVESTLNHGTTFRVELKLERTEQPISTETYDFNAINALIIDDDSATCDYIRFLFTRCGVACTAVTSGEQALETLTAAAKSGNKFTLCIVDWKMPQMDGIETTQRIRDIAGAEMPIVVLTAYDFSEISEQAAEVGITRFISKPLFQSSLFDLLVNIGGINTQSKEHKVSDVDFTNSRLLLAEDNAMNMEIAKTILEHSGFNVDQAWDGREVVDIFSASPVGTYDAILMDIHMPELNGLEATRTIRSCEHPEAKTIPIIAMTADAFAENVAEALNAGMNDHIAKPIEMKVLFATLEKYVKHVKD